MDLDQVLEENLESSMIYSLLRDDDLQVLAAVARETPADGQILVAGTYQGGDVMWLRQHDPHGRCITVVDSFAGLARSTQEDQGTPHHEGEFAQDLAGYLRNFAKAGFQPPDEIHQMYITQKSLMKVEYRSLSMVWFDLDYYQPTLDCLRRFVPWLLPGGVALVHDLDWVNCPGIRKACDQFGGHWKLDGFACGKLRVNETSGIV
jgi:O-methyltransferase